MTRPLKTIFILAIASLAAHISIAKAYLPAGQEVRFSYTAQFVTSSEDDREALAELHLNHLFGVFQSPEYAEEYDIDTYYSEGFAAIKLPTDPIRANESVTDDGKRKIRYTASGLMLLHNKIAESALQKKYFEVHLPYELDSAYKEDCTDPYCTDSDEYWYFNNLYREGCTDYQEMPHSKKVYVYIFPTRSHSNDLDPRLDLLRGDNGNGDLFSISIIQGFDESTSRRDGGRRSFNAINHHLKDKDFDIQVVSRKSKNAHYIFTGPLELNDGSEIKVEIHSILVDTDIESRGKAFGEFLKEAFKEADVVIYMGHSGLGGNLDVPSLEDEVGEFTFNPNKRQIFFFNTCSSYSHYLAHFEQLKPRKTLDILTNGLGLLFRTSSPVVEKFIDELLDPEVGDHSWKEILESMEAPLHGGSYLLNVGSL